MSDEERRPQMWRGMSAADAREQSYPVPDDVPDCAWLDMQPGEPSVTSDNGQVLNISMPMHLSWNWIHLEMEFSKVVKTTVGVEDDEPYDETDRCGDCGTLGPHYCLGVPGGFGDEEEE